MTTPIFKVLKFLFKHLDKIVAIGLATYEVVAKYIKKKAEQNENETENDEIQTQSQNQVQSD